MHTPESERPQAEPMNSDRLVSDPVRGAKVDRCGLVALDARQCLVGFFLGEELGEFGLLEAAVARLGGRWCDGRKEDIGVDRKYTASGILLAGRHS